MMVRERPASSGPNRFPMKALGFGILLTVALFVCGGGASWKLYEGFLELATTDLRLHALAGEIVHLDEVLTMSARMAVATGDAQWEARYRQFEPELDAAIKEAIAIAPEVLMHEGTSDTDAANTRLVAMENRAFELVRRGHHEAGAAILLSRDYEDQKAVYARGMEKTISDLGDRV